MGKVERQRRAGGFLSSGEEVLMFFSVKQGVKKNGVLWKGQRDR